MHEAHDDKANTAVPGHCICRLQLTAQIIASSLPCLHEFVKFARTLERDIE